MNDIKTVGNFTLRDLTDSLNFELAIGDPVGAVNADLNLPSYVDGSNLRARLVYRIDEFEMDAPTVMMCVAETIKVWHHVAMLVQSGVKAVEEVETILGKALPIDYSARSVDAYEMMLKRDKTNVQHPSHGKSVVTVFGDIPMPDNASLFMDIGSAKAGDPAPQRKMSMTATEKTTAEQLLRWVLMIANAHDMVVLPAITATRGRKKQQQSAPPSAPNGVITPPQGFTPPAGGSKSQPPARPQQSATPPAGDDPAQSNARIVNGVYYIPNINGFKETVPEGTQCLIRISKVKYVPTKSISNDTGLPVPAWEFYSYLSSGQPARRASWMIWTDNYRLEPIKDQMPEENFSAGEVPMNCLLWATAGVDSKGRNVYNPQRIDPFNPEVVRQYS